MPKNPEVTLPPDAIVITKRARELGTSFLSGNRTHVVDEVLAQEKEVAVALAVSIVNGCGLTKDDRATFKTLVFNRLGQGPFTERMMPGQTPYTPEQKVQRQGLVTAAAMAEEVHNIDDLDAGRGGES